jgi:hypothetical protein
LFYLAYPILSFLLNADARQQMYDAEALPDEQQKELAELPASDYVDWRKAARQIWAEKQTSGEFAQGAKQDADSATYQPLSAKPAVRRAGPLPADKEQSGVLPENWLEWLNQNADPRRQNRLQERFSAATPAQRQRMAQWFEKRQAQRDRQKQAQKRNHN